jgi:hypothetical protein
MRKPNTVVTQQDVSAFWSAPASALFDQRVIAAVIGFSHAWMERKRLTGGGVPFRKVGRKCLYQKADVVAWLDQFEAVNSTAEYPSACSFPAASS